MKRTTMLIVSFAAFAMMLCPLPGFSNKPLDERFKDWNYSPGEVFGLIKLENTHNRSWYKITHPDNQSVRVQEYNPAGVAVTTTMLRFSNGKLSLMTNTDQWGDTYETTKYIYSGNGEFVVTRITNGKNGYLPCKSARYIYRNNLLAEIRYLSYSGKLCNNSSGYAIIKYKRYEDKDRYSLIKEQSFYDTDGNPVISKSFDCHKVVYNRDARGNELSITYLGTNDEPLTNRYGGYKYNYTYDSKDNYLTWQNVGLNEEPTLNSYGCAKASYNYTNGLLTLETRYDDKNNVVKSSAAGDGIANVKKEFDQKGNVIQTTYFDENNQPINSTAGYHRITYKYSPSDALISIEYFDQNEASAANASGIHQYSYERDDKGRIIKEAFFDKTNSPAEDNFNEVYMIKHKYDESGREISTSYWKDDVTKMRRWNGFHENIMKYNQDGQEIERICFDENGNLCKTSDGYSRQVTSYNADASIADRGFFDGTTPIILTTGAIKNYHRIKYAFDNNGRVTSIEYFDEAGRPTDAAFSFDQDFSAHKIEFIYQGSRIVQENCYLANSDTPSKVIDCLKNDYVNTNGVNKGHKNQ